jgi:ABC-2 type transport system ATP-binding protein
LDGRNPDLSAGAPPAIEIERLTKRFRRVVALDGVSFSVPRGEVFGFLGPNGAGKTTTVRILLDLLRPTSGSARIRGLDCQRNGLEARSSVGYLPGELGLYRDMTGRRVLDLLARLERRPVDRARRRELLDRMRLDDADLDRPLREYSTGMKRKLGIVQAFQADPSLLVLDEPAEGLDPAIQDALWALLADAKRLGRTVFMSSHVLSEVERVCDRVALLRRGRLALAGTVEELRRRVARRVRVLFSRPVEAPREDWPDGCKVEELKPDAWALRIEGPLGPLLGRLSGLPVADVEVKEPHLDEVLLRFFREDA